MGWYAGHMNVVSRPTSAMTRERFLDWAARQGERYEFDGERPVRMTGGSRRHARIKLNLAGALRAALRGRPFDLQDGEGAGIPIPGGGVRYPDLHVTPLVAGRDEERLADDAIVVFEVVSPSSERLDRITKLREYGAVPSVRRYVVLESASPAALVYERESGDLPWRASALLRAESLALPELGAHIPLSDIYEGVASPPDDEEPRNPDATT